MLNIESDDDVHNSDISICMNSEYSMIYAYLYGLYWHGILLDPT